ncbi:MAG: hypothetical protein QOD83_2124 [Solirubrobacteraceae bacterium]|nr:hypothetical protein [Solirubrobacteraceae bacterium]
MNATRPLRLLPSWPLLVAVAAIAAAVGAVAASSPALGLLVVLGAAFALLMLADLTAGLLLFVGVSFLEALPPLVPAATVKATGLLLVLSWLATLAVRRRGVPSLVAARPALVALLALFLFWAGSSLLWARESAAVYTDLTRFLPLFALFLIMHAAVRTRRHVITLVLVVIGGAIVAAIAGILVPPPPDADAAGRLAGAEANALAPVLVAGAVLAAAFAGMTQRAIAVRLAAVAVSGFCIVGVVLTGSRGGLIGLAVALLVGLAFAGRARRARVVPVVAIAIALTVLYVIALAPPDLRARITETGDGSGRSDIWRVGAEIVKANPVLGVGAGNYEARSPEYVLQAGLIRRSDLIVDRPLGPHNIYLQVLSELGVVGLLLFLGIIGSALTTAAMAAQAFARQHDEQMELVARALFVTLCGMLTAGFFGSWLFHKQLWILMAMGPAMLTLAHQRSAEASPAAGLC